MKEELKISVLITFPVRLKRAFWKVNPGIDWAQLTASNAEEMSVMNYLKGVAKDWKAVCVLAASMVKCEPEEAEEFVDELVYMASSSFGGRREVATKETHRVGNKFGYWSGYSEEDSSEFEWTSATSGARIKASKEGGWWNLEFFGREDGGAMESWYVRSFSDAVILETLEGEVDNIRAIITALQMYDEGVGRYRKAVNVISEIGKSSQWLDWAERNVPAYNK